MALDWSRGPLAEGLACYKRAQYFEAHEHWESVWLSLGEPEKSFLQALIQITAAFHHLRAGNRVGTASLLRRSLRRLERCPAYFGGIAVDPMLAEISQWLKSIESGLPIGPSAPPEFRVIANRPQHPEPQKKY